MDLPTRIFLDGGDPMETAKADELLRSHGLPGLGGQTTNPSLIMKNLKARIGEGRTLHPDQAVDENRRIVREMARVISGPISIQVFAAMETDASDMVRQARERVRWIPNAVIKFPCMPEGVQAAEIFSKEGPLNMTLVFTQEQAAAVYGATAHRGTGADGKPYRIFVSPFVGRLDDAGENGMDAAANILEMYRNQGDGHVEVIVASVRNISHLLASFSMRADVVTAPYAVLEEWCAGGCRIPRGMPVHEVAGLRPIPYAEVELSASWTARNLAHPLTDKGVQAFARDWESLTGNASRG